MFYICEKYGNDMYGVMDTDDNVEEKYSVKEIVSFIKSYNLTIKGVSFSNGKVSVKKLTREEIYSDEYCSFIYSNSIIDGVGYTFAYIVNEKATKIKDLLVSKYNCDYFRVYNYINGAYNKDGFVLKSIESCGLLYVVDCNYSYKEIGIYESWDCDIHNSIFASFSDKEQFRNFKSFKNVLKNEKYITGCGSRDSGYVEFYNLSKVKRLSLDNLYPALDKEFSRLDLAYTKEQLSYY